MTIIEGQFRQGDVLIERIAPLTKDRIAKLAAVDAEGGRYVLAHGEATGHAHAIYDRVRMFRDGGSGPGGTLFIQVDRPTSVRHEEHAPIPLDPGQYRVIRQREYAPAAVRFVAD